MAIAKSAVPVFASALVPPGGTKAAPATVGAGQMIDNSSNGTSSLGWRIKNGASAPTVAGTMTIQQSPDGGTTWFDYFTISGSTVAGDDITGTIQIERGIKALRALCYGNATNPVTFEAILSAVAG